MSETVNTQQMPSMDPAMDGAKLAFQMMPGVFLPYVYNGPEEEATAYRTSAWIGTSLSISPIFDIVGPDACKFLHSVCVNDFSKLAYTGIRHAVMCNDKGQILTDGVVTRIAEDRYRTYWLNAPIKYLCDRSNMDVRCENMTGTEYFIQVQGEKSLEILEAAFEQDLHDIKMAKRRDIEWDGNSINVIRLCMTGNRAYEIHGPMSQYVAVYNRVWAVGQQFGAVKQGLLTYNLCNHTEAGFPNINVHYPMPWFETDDEMTAYMLANPMESFYNYGRQLRGSMGDELQERFVTPYDVGWEFLIKFNHEFTGRAALEKIAAEKHRVPVTLEWNAEDVGKVFSAMNTPGGERVDDITGLHDAMPHKSGMGMIYRADQVLADGERVGVSCGRIHSYGYNAMISIGFVCQDHAAEGTELTILWGTPGTKQMPVRATVARFPYNGDLVRNEDRDVEDIPHFQA